MIKKLKWFSWLIFTVYLTHGQYNNTIVKIDSLIGIESKKPFNGIILISRKGKTIYSTSKGFSDLNKKIKFKSDDQFVIGSISKQITAVLILQQYESGNLQLHQPIRKYLPQLNQSWADTVTLHHLLTHTHGITEIDKPVSFVPGTQYAYSQIGYQLLADILEKITKKSFALLSEDLFMKCKMKNTFHPDLNKHKHLVKGYFEDKDGKVKIDLGKTVYIPAGGFISTPEDMLLWDTNLFSGKLLNNSTYRLMTTKQKNATRNHPIFGLTNYGYGITVDTKNDIIQLGQTGLAPGYASMNFHFPDTNVNVIVMQNVINDLDDFKKTFFYHLEILKIIRESDLVKKTTAIK